LKLGRKQDQLQDGRQTAPYSLELEPDIVLTQPHASGVDETCTPLVIAEGGSIGNFTKSLFNPTVQYRHDMEFNGQ